MEIIYILLDERVGMLTEKRLTTGMNNSKILPEKNMRKLLTCLAILVICAALPLPVVSSETNNDHGKEHSKEQKKENGSDHKKEAPKVAEPLEDKPDMPEKKVVKKVKKVSKKKPIPKAEKPPVAVLPSLPPPAPMTTAENFNTRIAVMSRELEKNMDHRNAQDRFVVTSFANLDKLSETTSFGRLVAENVIHELQLRKWRVFEVRLTRDIIINETGEFTLSRDIRQLKEQYNITGIVTGTYSIAGNTVILNARVIDINTGLVISSAQVNMPVAWFSELLSSADGHFKGMKIVGDSSAGAKH